jgi:hypothetical protein
MNFRDLPDQLKANPALNLKRDPFALELSAGNGPARFRYDESRPLVPFRNRQYLELYLNPYDWRSRTKVDGLDQNGRLITLQPGNAPDAMVLLVSGFKGCGRTSMINLLRYEIEQQMAPMGWRPIVVPYSAAIVGTEAVDHALDIAESLANEAGVPPTEASYDAPGGALLPANRDGGAGTDGQAAAETARRARDRAKELEDTIRQTASRWRQNVLPGREPRPESLFRNLRRAIPEDLRVVVQVEAVDQQTTPASWLSICDMLRQLADFIIVSLSNTMDRDTASAALVRSAVETGRLPAGWINAPRVARAQMETLLAARLARERRLPDTDTNSLVPFTPEALAALYKTAGGSTGPVTLPISAALKVLAGAFTAKSNALGRMLASGQQPLATDIPITDRDVEQYLRDHPLGVPSP